MQITLINDWWCSTDTRIGTSDTSNVSDYQKHNAHKFNSFMSLYGFSLNAISAMLGNAQVESYLSPASTETGRATLQTNTEMMSYSRGLGLMQWTGFNPSGNQKLVAYCELNGWNWYDGDAQCNRLIYERDNNFQFDSVTVSGVTYTWDNFYNSENSVEDLTKAWCWGYERPENPDMERRINNAEYWYQYFIEHPVEPGNFPVFMLYNRYHKQRRIRRCRKI